MTHTGTARNTTPEKEPIAIIGIGCRYPGGVKDPHTFWRLLCDGVNAITEIPSSRIDVETYFDPRPATPGKMMTRWGGFLDDIDQFDAAFFGISPREAERLDPQQRLLLEVAWEAFEDAGQHPETLKGSLTGVYTGLWLNDFEGRLFADPSQTDFYMTTGSGRYSASGRVSFFFGMQGPSITIDTACSSSLVAVHLACQSLWTGETTLALAGGANVILQPHISIAYSQSKMMAPDGRCKFGDAQADGYVRSEGAALIVLKRLSEAMADGDSIYAVIRGGAINNDGQSSGFLATPGQQGQEEMLRLAYERAGVDPHQVQYVEAHGTGTRAGDPIEIGALGTILGRGRSPQTPLRVGSVKTNLGHTEGAAGIAGLIKVALALKNGIIPPSLHLNTFNPNIPWQELNITIPRELTPWHDDMPRVAGISAFGIAGTNAHVVLESAPVVTVDRAVNSASTYLLPLSAQTRDALKDAARSYTAYLSDGGSSSLADICYTSACRRTHHTERLAVSGRSAQELIEQLSIFIERQDTNAESQNQLDGDAKIAFVFPGQGAQWTGMGRELLQQNAAFRDSLTRCDAALRAYTDWSLLEQLSLSEDSPSYRLNEISVIQPVLFAMEVALAEMWRAWGVEPAAVIGHSMGEVAAAYIAGALSLDDAARVICKRSQLMQSTSGKGAMAVIGLPYRETEALLKGYEGRLSLAVQNSPKSTVLSGDPDALQEVMNDLQQKEIFNRLIKVDVASHSPQMDPIRPELVESLQGIQPRAASIPFYSTVEHEIRAGESLDAGYWGQNLRQPVRFSETVQHMLEDGHVIFIEMSPHPILLSSIEETRRVTEKSAHGIASTRRDQPELAAMLTELGSLFVLGYPIDWSRVYPERGTIVALPTYPWQRERFWFTSTKPNRQMRPGAHPLLEQHIRTATGEHVWETSLSTRQFPYLNDHQVRGSVVFPAAGYTEMMLAAATEAFGAGHFLLHDLSFHEALFLTPDKEQVLQLVMSMGTSDAAELQIFSSSVHDAASDSWTLHASGRLERLAESNADTKKGSLPAERQHNTTAEEFYRSAMQRGLEYGTQFQSIMLLSKDESGIVARIKLSSEVASQAARYQVHPVLLDACFQALLEALPASNHDAYLPVSLQSITLHAKPGAGDELWCHVIPASGEKTTGTIRLFDTDGQLCVSIDSLAMRRIEANAEPVSHLLHEIQWQPVSIPAQTATTTGTWLIFADHQGTGTALDRELESCILVTAANTYSAHAANRFEIDPSQPAHFQQLLQAAGNVHGIVHLWSLDSDSFHNEEYLQSILYLTQALAQQESSTPARLWLITRGTQSVLAQPEAVSVSGDAVWGMGAVIANELPALHCSRIDLNPVATEGEAQLLAQTLTSSDEDMLALRSGQVYAARMKRVQPSAEKEMQQHIQQLIPYGQPFEVQVVTPGILDSLSLKPAMRKHPRAGQVEIQVKATGLNFMNVMGALGIYPGYPRGVGPLGIECAGVITVVGEGVQGFEVGDEVAGVAFDSLASHAVTDARLMVKKPSFMSFEEAATMPIAFLTAYYALHHLGHMEAGERVLIHAATGGVGLAALQLAQRAGAEIFATAGSDEKRALLHSMGIQHVMDSRSLTFAADVIQATHGEGVDLVLNSLAGAAITKGLEILKPYGRFLEIGKRDIYGNSKIGLLPFQKSLSYFAIDLDKTSRERPEVMGRMLREIFKLLENGELKPLPVRAFPVSNVSDAFRTMAQAKHIGKIVITLEDANAAFDVPAGSIPVRADATYLITGGLGDLGLTFARWLVGQGARHLVLLGRSQPSVAAQKMIDELCAAGVNVITRQADVTDAQQVKDVIAHIQTSLPPLKGILHAAGLLADATVPGMDWDRFKKAYAPKSRGAWNLHTLTLDQPLDFFILFSSVAATLGIPGQINYAAGNAYLDGLARLRHAQNLPALSINWGPWSEIGLASSDANRGERLMQQGLKSITPSQGLEVMSGIMAPERPQVSVLSIDVNQWCMAQPAAARSSLFKDLLGQTAAETVEKKLHGQNIREELLATAAGRPRRQFLDACLREQVAQVLHLPVSRVPSDKPLKTLGLDSLMSIELRNRLEDALGVSLSASLIWNYPTVNALVPFLAEKMGVGLDGQEQAEAGKARVDDQREGRNDPESKPSSSELDNLDKDELEALLADELSAIDETLKGSGFDTETGTR